MAKPAPMAAYVCSAAIGCSVPVERNFPWGFTFRNSWWPGGKNWQNEKAITVEDAALVGEFSETEDQGQSGNWVFNILNVKSLWKGELKDTDHLVEELEDGDMRREEDEACDVSSVDDIDCTKFDRESFSDLLRKVPLRQARFYARMSYLGNLAYSISQIKLGDLLRSHGLRFVTSSLEKKEHALKAEQENNPQKGMKQEVPTQ